MNKYILALLILLISTVGITGLALFTILQNPEQAKDIFNIILPVFSSWVGTVLAFYFGRENYESANRQVWELVERLTPEQRAKASVTSIIRHFRDITYFQIPSGQNEQNIKLSELYGKLVGNISRLPIIDADMKPKYMIHKSRLDDYLATDHSKDDNLEQFINRQKSTHKFGFGLNEGFVVVSEQTSIAEAKRKMKSITSCQDIFITKDGNPDEPLIGWISNVRMAKYLIA